MKCQILSPDKYKVFNEIKTASLPGYRGQFQILPEHAETFQLLSKGTVFLEKNDGKIIKKDIAKGACRYIKKTLTIIL